MITVPTHVKNSKIGQDIRQTPGNLVIILRDERYPHISKLLRMITSKTAVACILVTSIVLYTSRAPFLRAEATSFYPKACLGGFEGVGNAEGKPETKVTSRSDAFDRDISAFLSGEQSAEMYCGNFDGKIVDKTVPKQVTLTLFLATKTKEESQVIKADAPETTNADFLEVLDAAKTPILESSATTTIETNSTSSPQVEGEVKESGVNESSSASKEKATDNGGSSPQGDMAAPSEEKPVPPAETNETKSNITSPDTQSVSADSPQAFQNRNHSLTVLISLFAQKVRAEETAPTPTEVSQVMAEPVAAPSSLPETVIETSPLATDSGAQVDGSEESQSISSSPEKKEEISDASEVKEEVSDVTTSPLSSLSTQDQIIKTNDESPSTEVVDVVSTPLDDAPSKVETVSVAQSIKDALESFQASDNTATTTEHPFFEIAYNLGGEEWTPLAYLGKENSRTISLTLPQKDDMTWADINKLQVRIKNTDSLDTREDLYVDGMALSIGYEKDLEGVRDYHIKDIENTSADFEVSEGGDEGGFRTVRINAKEKSGIAIYDLDSKSLVLTTETSQDSSSELDPNGVFPEYGVYGLFFTTDTNWCSEKELEECLSGDELRGVSFVSLSGSDKEAESKSATSLKKIIRERLFARGMFAVTQEKVNEGVATTTETTLLSASAEKESSEAKRDQKEEVRAEAKEKANINIDESASAEIPADETPTVQKSSVEAAASQEVVGPAQAEEVVPVVQPVAPQESSKNKAQGETQVVTPTE